MVLLRRPAEVLLQGRLPYPSVTKATSPVKRLTLILLYYYRERLSTATNLHLEYLLHFVEKPSIVLLNITVWRDVVQL